MTNRTNGKTDGDPIEQLLPWYATGKLENGERIEVERALARRPELRLQLELIREEIAETVKLHEAMPAPRPGAKARFMHLLERETVPPPMPGQAGGLRELAGRLIGWCTAKPRWVIAAVALALFFQTAVIGALVAGRQDTLYRTAAGPQERLASSLALVRFAEQAPLAAITAKLTRLGVTIIDGPRADGLFTLRIGPADMPAAERDRLIAALKSDAAIVPFVAPVE
jgi:anti-sigma factor RsiW